MSSSITEFFIPTGVKRKRNGNKLSQYFITFPRTDISREEFAKTLPESTYLRVVQETHEDGGYHLHALIILKEEISKPKLMKYVKASYPEDYKRIDYQAVKDMIAADTYLQKEDTSPFISGSRPRRRIKTLKQIENYYIKNPGKYYEHIGEFCFPTLSH